MTQPASEVARVFDEFKGHLTLKARVATPNALYDLRVWNNGVALAGDLAKELLGTHISTNATCETAPADMPATLVSWITPLLRKVAPVFETAAPQEDVIQRISAELASQILEQSSRKVEERL